VGGPRVRAILLAGVAAGACFCAPRFACADEAAPEWLQQVTLNGFFSSSYSYNFNRPDSRTNQLRVFDFDDNTFKLDVFELVAQKAVAKARDAGFRVDFTFGSSIPRVTAAAGLFNEPGQIEDMDVQQAYVSWIAPAGAGLRLDFGKFVTSAGYEVIEGYDGWNDNATRSLLFGYAIPFTHVGLRAAYPLSSVATLTGMLVNGWDVARDNNSSKTLGAQLALTPSKALSIYVDGMWGPERPDNDSDPRTLLDTEIIFKAASGLTLGVNADWGIDRKAIVPGPFEPSQDAQWSGIAGYFRVAVRPDFALIARAESFDDRDGFRTGTAQSITTLTLTPELRLTPHLLVRADARNDRSTRSVYQKGNDVTDSQPTVLFNVLYSF
jgi:hypothetical protein